VPLKRPFLLLYHLVRKRYASGKCTVCAPGVLGIYRVTRSSRPQGLNLRSNRINRRAPQLVKQPYHPTLPRSIGTDTMTQPGLIVSSRDGNVAIVKLNRPEKRNALSQDLIDELIEVLSQSDQDVTVRAVVLTGSEQGPFSGMSSAGSKRAR